MPKVWNIKDPKTPADAVYVGRGSPWGNPFKRGVDGNRKEVIEKFEIETLPNLDVSELKGKDLVCFCKPKSCHADSILRKANDPFEDLYDS